MRLAIVIALVSSTTAMAQVEVVRPVPRGPGQHGFTIEVPTPGAIGSFEVLRGGRPPDAPAAEEAAPVPPAGAPRATRAIAPVQMAPVRPVEVAPVAMHGSSGGRGDARTVRVQRGPGAWQPPPFEPGDDSEAPLPALPAGARVIRIR